MPQFAFLNTRVTTERRHNKQKPFETHEFNMKYFVITSKNDLNTKTPLVQITLAFKIIVFSN